MMWLSLIWNNKLTRTLVGAALAVMAALSFGAIKKREGRKEAEQKATEADYENADDIRDRARAVTPEQLREYDDAGFRD